MWVEEPTYLILPPKPKQTLGRCQARRVVDVMGEPGVPSPMPFYALKLTYVKL